MPPAQAQPEPHQAPSTASYAYHASMLETMTGQLSGNHVAACVDDTTQNINRNPEVKQLTGCQRSVSAVAMCNLTGHTSHAER